MAELEPVLADLAAEGEDLERLVAGLPAASWDLPTPAPGWTIAHQIAHLAWTDEAAITAATDPEAFGGLVQEAIDDFEHFVDKGAKAGAAQPPDQILERWRSSRTTLAAALRATPAGTKLPWYGLPIGLVSMATARLMETWAHGLDVADALGVRRELTARDGTTQWSWGPGDAEQRVSGPAIDFCLLVTQRRHRADLALTAEGAEADQWLDIAQAFAGPPGAGRQPGGAG